MTRRHDVAARGIVIAVTVGDQCVGEFLRLGLGIT